MKIGDLKEKSKQFQSKLKKLIESRTKDKNTQEDSINIILTDDNRYEEDKSLIEDAIKIEDWEFLRNMKTSRTVDFPGLIQMIDEALKKND